MQREPFENALLLAVNPVFKSIIDKIDVDCEQDGSLLIRRGLPYPLIMLLKKA